MSTKMLKDPFVSAQLQCHINYSVKVLKKGDMTVCDNWQSIMLLSIVPIVLCKVILNHILLSSVSSRSKSINYSVLIDKDKFSSPLIRKVSWKNIGFIESQYQAFPYRVCNFNKKRRNKNVSDSEHAEGK